MLRNRLLGQQTSLDAPWIERLEGDGRLDGLVRVARAGVAPLAGPRGDLLRGEGFGHAVHPVLTDFPLGCWLSAGLLDLVGGRRAGAASQRLVGLGLLWSIPTVLTGAAELAAIDEPATQRVAAVHASGNLAVATLYAASWRSRRRGAHARGVLLGLAGGGLACVSAYLGGHLSLVREAGHGARWGAPSRRVERPSEAVVVTPDESMGGAPLGAPTRAPVDAAEEHERLVVDAAAVGEDPEAASQLADDLARTIPEADAMRLVDRHLASGETVAEARAELLPDVGPVEEER